MLLLFLFTQLREKVQCFEIKTLVILVISDILFLKYRKFEHSINIELLLSKIK